MAPYVFSSSLHWTSLESSRYHWPIVIFTSDNGPPAALEMIQIDDATTCVLICQFQCHLSLAHLPKVVQRLFIFRLTLGSLSSRTRWTQTFVSLSSVWFTFLSFLSPFVFFSSSSLLPSASLRSHHFQLCHLHSASATFSVVLFFLSLSTHLSTLAVHCLPEDRCQWASVCLLRSETAKVERKYTTRSTSLD